MPDPNPALRASDEERDHVAASLAVHWRAGRIDLQTFDERASRAYAAETLRELATLVADLPALPGDATGRPTRPPAATPAAERRRRWLLPGYRPFREEVVLRAGRERTFDDALRHIVPKLALAGYHLVHSERPGLLRFSHKTSPDWALPITILTFGAGIFTYALQVEKPLTILLLDDPDGTRLIAFGDAPRPVRAAFATLED